MKVNVKGLAFHETKSEDNKETDCPERKTKKHTDAFNHKPREPIYRYVRKKRLSTFRFIIGCYAKVTLRIEKKKRHKKTKKDKFPQNSFHVHGLPCST